MVTTGTCILISVIAFILGGNLGILTLALLSIAKEKKEKKSEDKE